MKKSYIAILLLAGSFTLSGCNDFLDYNQQL